MGYDDLSPLARALLLEMARRGGRMTSDEMIDFWEAYQFGTAAYEITPPPVESVILA